MRLLLDTHVVLWWLTDDATLSEEIKALIDEEREVYVSPVTIWEVTIKQALGKIQGPSDLAEQIRDSEFLEVAIQFEHGLVAGRLPAIHRDPFDRMLVAQAQCEELMIVTRDVHIPKYGVQLLAA